MHRRLWELGPDINPGSRFRDTRSGGGLNSNYLVHDVFEAVGTVDGEADEEDVGFGVGEGAQAVVFFLAGGIPEGELDHFACWRVRRVGDVVFEDCGDVFL